MRKFLSCLALAAMLITCSSKKMFDHDYFSIGVSKGMLDSSQINEASGIVASQANKGMLWTHNDSGDEARFFLIDSNAHHKATYYLKDTESRDWEEIAIGPVPDEETFYLYLCDIGDNYGRYEYKYIYRIREPDFTDDVESILVDTIRTGIDTIKFRLSDKPRDTEALFVDPLTSDIYIFSKREKKEVKMYVLPYPQSTSQIDTAVFVMNIPYTQLVAADISSDGSEILMKNYKQVFYWKKNGDEQIKDMLKRPAIHLPYAAEPQGEAITFSYFNDGYYTLSEAANNKIPHLMFYKRKGKR